MSKKEKVKNLRKKFQQRKFKKRKKKRKQEWNPLGKWASPRKNVQIVEKTSNNFKMLKNQEKKPRRRTFLNLTRVWRLLEMLKNRWKSLRCFRNNKECDKYRQWQIFGGGKFSWGFFSMYPKPQGKQLRGKTAKIDTNGKEMPKIRENTQIYWRKKWRKMRRKRRKKLKKIEKNKDKSGSKMW